MRKLLSPILLLLCCKGGACICVNYLTIDSAAKLSNFIAHVKVVEKIKLSREDSIGYGGYSWSKKLRFEIIELFKGDTSSLTIIDNGEFTSCNIGIWPGGEYILFGYAFNEKYSIVDFCFKWFILRDSKGQRNWNYEHGLYGLKELRKIFNHEAPVIPDGVKTTFYPNGNIESVEEYLDGRLNNNQKIYFANGQLRYDRNYKIGSWDGISKDYAESGQLLEEGLYRSGKEIRTTQWYDTSRNYFSSTLEKYWISDIVVKRQEFYISEKDSVYCYKEYSPKKNLIEEAIIYNKEKDDCYVKYRYHENGRLNYQIEYYRKTKKEYYKQWNKRGKPEMDRIYIDGKLTPSTPTM
ncbi:MAG: hypothetical protein HOP10_14635 [Chitinophagaceae bacterium]|nr:hypothetical protein [Chitinophagaceae bacterium]